VQATVLKGMIHKGIKRQSIRVVLMMATRLCQVVWMVTARRFQEHALYSDNRQSP